MILLIIINLIKDVKFRNNIKIKIDENYSNINNSNELYKKFIQTLNKDKIKINLLNCGNNSLKSSYNFDNKKYLLNNNNENINDNNSYDFIMSPNDLYNIYRKNIIFILYKSFLFHKGENLIKIGS